MANIVLNRISSGAVGAARFEAISADGNFALFSDSEQAGPFQRLVRVNLATGAADVVVTPSVSGDEGYNGTSAISADGRFVAYVVAHMVQIGGLTVDFSNIYRKDMSTGDVTVVSSSNGSPENSFSLLSGISTDGRFVAFVSEADDLVPGDTNNLRDGFIKDLATGAMTRVQTDAVDMVMSPDAKTIFFQQSAGGYFTKDLTTNVSTSLSNGFVQDVSFSQNGRFVVFTDNAKLAADDTNSFKDIYVKDLQTGKITLVSKTMDGTVGNADSGFASISADGQRVTFISAANNLVAGDLDNKPDVFVKDLATGIVTLVAPASSPTSGRDLTGISADGSKIGFTTPEDFILKGDVDGLKDGYVATFLNPTLTINTISGDNRVNAIEAAAPVVVSGTSSAIGQLVTIADDFSGIGGPHTHLVTVQANGTWSTTFSVSGLLDGGHTFSASVIDDAGLVQDATRTVLLDRIPPSLTIDTIAGDNVINAAEAPAAIVSGTSDAFGRTVTLTIDGTVVGIAFVQGDGTWSTSIDAAGIADGTHNVVAEVSDLAGNPATVTHGVTVDITLPALTIGPVTGDNLISSDEVSGALPVSGTSNAIGGTVTVLVDSNPAGTALVGPDGSWSTTVDATGLSQGVHVFAASEADAAGNIGGASEAVTVYSQVTRLVSAPEGTNFGITGFHPSISGDGRYVAFQENEDSLVFGDNNGTADIVVKDLSNGTFRLVSVDVNGAQGNDASQQPIISSSGRFVVFDSRASNLVASDANDKSDAFIKDLQTGEVRLVSVTSGGAQGDDFSHVTAVSADGRYVAFFSTADNFFSGDSAFTHDLFVKDLQTGALTHVNIGTVNNTEGLTANLSADGRYIAFWSDAMDLIPGVSANGNIFVTDLQTGTTELASSAAGGTPGDNFSEFLSLSANGRIVAFTSFAHNLTPGVVFPADAARQIYVKNLDTGEISIASTSSTGALQELTGSGTPSLSADGRIVAFSSTANNLVAGDPGDPFDDVFVKNLDTGVTVVASHGQFGPPNRESGNPALSGDGSVVAFESGATNIVSTHDSDFTPNIYAADLKPPLAKFAPIAGDNLINASEAAGSVTIGGTSNNVGATIDLTVDGFAAGSTTVLPDATWALSVDASGLVNGPHLFAANVHALSGLQYTNTAVAAVDTIAPTLTLNSDKVHLAAGETATITFAFSEAVSGFDLADITVAGGSLGALIAEDTHTYHAVFTPDVGVNSASIEIDVGAVVDLAGNPNAAASATLGLAIDGYIAGATVFKDANNNGVLDLGEVATTTDANGAFMLSGGSGPIVMTGGIDIGTGLPFAGSLTAPADATVATPLTTLTAILTAQNVTNPEQKVLAAFALDPSIDLAHLDPIAPTLGGDAKAEAVFAAGAVTLDTVTLIASALAGTDPAQFATSSHNVFVELADIIADAVSPVDLTATGQIGTLINSTLALEGKSFGAGVIDGLTQIVAATNMAVLGATQTHDGVAGLAEITAVERVAQGAAADALKGLDGDPTNLLSAVAAYADHLDVAIAAARSQTGDIDGPDHSTAPVAVNDSFSTAQNTSLAISASGVLSNDTDADGDTLTAVKAGGPSHGSLTLNSDGSFLYTPESGYSGADSFSYTANDGSADSNDATVSITIIAPSAANSAPVAQPDSYQLNEDTTLIVAAPGVLANDTDTDANPLSAVLVDGPAHGTLGLKPDGSLTYVPDAQYNGPDSFSYKANDGSAMSVLTTVSLAINAVDDAPATQAGSASGDEDKPIKGHAVATDIDTPANQLVYSLVGINGGAQHGTVSISADGSFSYLGAPNYNGPDSFSFRANDGSLDSEPGTVAITVNPVNDAPAVIPLTASLGEDGPSFSRDLLSSASDPDQGTVLAVKNLDSSVTTTSGRALVLGNDYTLSGSTLVLTAAGFAKFNDLPGLQADQAVFHFGVTDGILTTANALTLTVTGANDTPTLTNQTANQSAIVDTHFSLMLPGNTFADVDNGDHLTLTATRSDGTSLPPWLAFNAATATFGGTPGAGDVGGFDVKVTATDIGGLMATDSFHFTIAAASNHAPLITSTGSGDTASIIITDDSRYAATVHATDPDPGSKITYSIVAGADQKLFNIDPKSGVLSFKSEPRDGHDYQVTVAASDGILRDTQSLKVRVANGPFESGNSGVADTFEFRSNFGLAIVNNFDATSPHHDVLELDHALFRNADVNMSAKALQDLIDSHSFQLGPDTVIFTDAHNVIDVRNTELHNLTAGDFHIV